MMQPLAVTCAQTGVPGSRAAGGFSARSDAYVHLELLLTAERASVGWLCSARRGKPNGLLQESIVTWPLTHGAPNSQYSLLKSVFWLSAIVYLQSGRS